MTATIHTDELLTSTSAESLLTDLLALSASLKLPTTSWRTGDPTLTQYQFLCERLEELDAIVAKYAQSGFQSEAQGDWATINARDTYGVERTAATYAVSAVTLTNTQGGYYELLGVGGMTFKSSATGKTYRSTDESIVINPGPGFSLTVNVQAEEAGSDSSLSLNDIDEIVSPALPGVEISGSTAGAAIDAQNDDELLEACLDSLGALSPAGAPDAYEYVVTRQAYTDVTEITRAQTIYDDDDGDVVVYVAGVTGAVSPAAVTAAQTAVDRYVEPWGFNAEAQSAVTATVDVLATYSTPDGVTIATPDGAEAAVQELLQTIRISGTVARSSIIATLQAQVHPESIITLTTPAADVELADGEVAVPGTFSFTGA